MSVHDSPPITLPTAQRAILALAATGATTAEIAPVLQFSVQEIHEHLGAAIEALAARSKLEAVVTALRLGLTLVPSDLQCDILRALADGATLVGTIRTLARSLGVSMNDLRVGLRGLLEVRLIALYSGQHEALVVRFERRGAPALSPVLPAVERRRPRPDIRLL
jgi:DNA-binding CsgD family transcriptional regulator